MLFRCGTRTRWKVGTDVCCHIRTVDVMKVSQSCVREPELYLFLLFYPSSYSLHPPTQCLCFKSLVIYVPTSDLTHV